MRYDIYYKKMILWPSVFLACSNLFFPLGCGSSARDEGPGLMVTPIPGALKLSPGSMNLVLGDGVRFVPLKEASLMAKFRVSSPATLRPDSPAAGQEN